MGKTGKILGVNEISKLVHMSRPLLMLDRVKFNSETSATGLRVLAVNEQFFQGHFPAHPILPGVLQIEAMKQLAQLLVGDKLDPSGTRDVYIRMLQNVKFRKPNLPGDRMRVECEVLEENELGILLSGKVFNRNGLTCEAKITLSARDLATPAEFCDEFDDYDLGENSYMQLGTVMEYMPHRYPFLFVDYISRRDGDRVQAIKNVTIGDEFFASCRHPVPAMPEALLCEFCAQAGCACILSAPENVGKLGYFMSIDKAEFFSPVYPGDRMIGDVILPPVKGRFGKSSGEIRVGDRMVTKITLMFAIVDK